MIDKAELFEAKKYARSIVKDIVSDANNETKAFYQDKFLSLLRNHKTPFTASKTSRSFYTNKAAFVWGGSVKIRDMLKQSEKLEKEGNYAEALKFANGARKLAAKISPYSSNEVKWSDRKQDILTKESDGEDIHITSKKSKKYTLGKLPKDWKNQLFNHALNKTKPSQWLKDIALLEATGLRPSELELGVEVRHQKGYLAIKIKGTKTNGGKYGQEIREIAVKVDSDATKWLAEQVDKNGGKLAHTQPKTKYLAKALNAYSRQLGFSELVSAYSYRHSLGASMKASKVDPVMIATVLGHSSTRTQQYYGHYQNGSEGQKIVAKCSGQVRVSNHQTIFNQSSSRSPGSNFSGNSKPSKPSAPRWR